MKVLIIEDEAPAFRRLQKVLEEIIPDVQIVEVIDSVEETVKWVRNHHLPDLIFMDIQLSDGISFEIFEQVNINKPVIFTTAFDDYMLKAFKVNSIDYLLKPIKKEDLALSIQKYQSLKKQFGQETPTVDITSLVSQIRSEGKQYKTRFLVKQGEKLISIETSQIAYFYTQNGVVHLVTSQNRNYLMDQTLEEVNAQLDPAVFYRANRQFIVQFAAIAHVERYHKGKLLIETSPAAKEDIVVSAEKAAELKKWLDQ